MNFYENYVRLCIKIGKTPSKVAEEIGISKSAVSRWKDGGGITDPTAIKLANYFGVSVHEIKGHLSLDGMMYQTALDNGLNSAAKLIEDKTEQKEKLTSDQTDERDEIIVPNIFKIETKKFPLLGNIACGEPVFASEEMGLYIEAGANIHADFCLKASGDSMIGARIHDGDIVFIRQQSSVNNGEIAAVLIEDEATLKRIYYDPDSSTISLFAENPAYKTLRFHGAELDKVRILGKAVAFQSDIR